MSSVLVASAVAVMLGSFGGGDGGPVYPTRDPNTSGSVTAFCNAGTQDIGVIYNSGDRYSLGNYDVALKSNTCTTQWPIEWQYVQGFYVGPDRCVDIRIDGSPKGHRVESGQWFYEDMIAGTYNLNGSNC